MRPTFKRLRGFAIVSAIFILVVLAALGAFIVTVFGNQQAGSALDVLGVRAYQAARAGIEWGLYKQLQTVPASCAATSSFTPAAPSLSGFAVTVICTASVPACGGSAVTAGSFATGMAYQIQTVGTTNFTLIGAASNTVGVAFTARGAGTGTGTAIGCEPIVRSIVSTACSEPDTGWPATTAACPNSAPGPRYVERRLAVTF
jgi:MSHA biogenesis protein MshP